MIALGALMCIVLLKGSSASLLYESIAEEIVWLMIGSFIIGESVKPADLPRDVLASCYSVPANPSIYWGGSLWSSSP